MSAFGRIFVEIPSLDGLREGGRVVAGCGLQVHPGFPGDRMPPQPDFAPAPCVPVRDEHRLPRSVPLAPSSAWLTRGRRGAARLMDGVVEVGGVSGFCTAGFLGTASDTRGHRLSPGLWQCNKTPPRCQAHLRALMLAVYFPVAAGLPSGLPDRRQRQPVRGARHTFLAARGLGRIFFGRSLLQ